MYFVENQQLQYENVLSYRTRISEGSMPELIQFVIIKWLIISKKP